ADPPLQILAAAVDGPGTLWTSAPRRNSVRLAIEPHVFHAPAVERAVRHQRQSLHLRLVTGRGPLIVDDRPHRVLDQLALDPPGNLLAHRRIALHRLLHDQPIELRAAIAGHIARRAAHIIFDQLRIRVVDRTTRGALRDRIVLAYQL